MIKREEESLEGEQKQPPPVPALIYSYNINFTNTGRRF